MNLERQSLLSCLFLCCFFPALFAQQNAQLLAQKHLLTQGINLEQSARDLSDLIVTDHYTSKHNGLTHVYFKQRYQGIDIFNAISGVHLKATEEEVVFSTNRFYNNLVDRVSSSTPNVAASEALRVISQDLKLPFREVPIVLSRSGNKQVFEATTLSDSPIPTQLVYWPTEDEKLRLSWNVRIDDPRDAAVWNIFVDVENGQILNKKDATIYCTFDDQAIEDCTDNQTAAKQNKTMSEALVVDGATYNVFPVPVESPNHGNRIPITNPADPIASPFGWHDTNGREGPEYTFTRGNNVHAYRDAVPDDGPDGPEPDGGPELIFDFPYTIGGSPNDNAPAAITQLFYMNNFIHDFAYQFGFDEESGNYQQNNYGKGGRQGDPVRAEAQDGSGFNNANFTPSEDGINGKMQMFLFTSSNSTFSVTSPATLTDDYTFTSAAFGPILLEPLLGELVAPTSGPDNLLIGCTEYNSPGALVGKIALIDRGNCTFEEKAKRAEAAGAIACIVCNNEAGLLTMGDVDTIPDPKIPSIMITQADCARFRAQLENTPVTVRLDPPDFLDSDFDNGIIAHEYAHGISTRLTGGPSEPFCLANDEQMGEGWSDFFLLASLAQPGDNGEVQRSVGTFPFGQNVQGNGFRRQRYSTDIAVNNLTYDDVIGTSAPHPLGEVWAATLWDIYWALSEEYGFDPDPSNKNAGNNRAIQLVMDGMKLQACRPGFIDGRDGIIAADLINNNGENECMLWAVFSARGLGWDAQQGGNRNRNDNIEAYNLRPECLPALEISKTSTALIQPGEAFTVTITVNNNKATAVTDVVINDQIPTGATLIPGSQSGIETFRIEGDALSFDLGTLPPGAIKRISYQLQSDPGLFSTSLFFDDAESFGIWSASDLSGNDIWRQTTTKSFTGERSWFIANTPRANDQVLRLIRSVKVSAEQPIMRFYHSYDIEPGLDGGIVEISTNNLSWTPLNNDIIFRKPYIGRVANNTFNLGKQKAFWGDSKGFVATYIDLSDYIGEDILFRFRYSSNVENGDNPELTEGWYVDDMEVMDMYNYAGQVCITTAEGDNICKTPESRGTVVETALPTSSEDLLADAFSFEVFPNPVQSVLNVAMRGHKRGSVQLELTTLDGRVLERRQVEGGFSARTEQIDLSQLPRGVYLLKAKNEELTRIEKIVVQ
jgi:uncharacterized repeat protein (TIGR01451 family)